ncbi:MAG: serine hydrolase domain-containing protein [Limisphaerales bacterium]
MRPLSFHLVTILAWGWFVAASTAATTQPYLPPAFPQSHEERAALVRGLAPEIRAAFERHAASNHIPGVAYGVVVDGELVVAGGHGVANIEGRIPATPRTVFRVASMTKSFTAMSILRLRDAGKLDLDRPASRYLPELRRLRMLTDDAPPITLRRLLTHGAGFPEDNPWGDRQLADSDQDLVDLVRSPVWFSNAPGVAFEYSNLGFALLGRAVARVSGTSCQRYIVRNILAPLGMNSTYWEPTEVPKDLLAHGYRWEDDTWKEEALLGDGSFAPMGGMLSTVEDFARYIALHLDAWPPRDGPESPVLKRASIREMHHPWRLSGLLSRTLDSSNAPCPTVTAYGYGLGWAQDCHDLIRIGHSGGLPGFGSQWRILPYYGIGIVGLGNVTYAGFGGINTEVLELLLQRTGLKPRTLPASRILRERAATLISLLPDWTGAEATGIFAENFFPDQPLKILRRDCRQLFEKAGAIGRIDEPIAENQLRGTVVLHGATADLEVYFTLSPENPPLIQEFEIRERAQPKPTP